MMTAWYTNVSDDAGGLDIFNDVNEQSHKIVYKAFSPAFSVQGVDSHGVVMKHHVQQLFNTIRDRSEGKVVEMQRVFHCYATDIMFDIICGSV